MTLQPDDAARGSRGYRALFAAAALCNFALAAASGLFPFEFFAWLGTAPPAEPVPWPGIAAVMGAFGFLYGYAAWRPERGDVAVAIGLAAKVGGPTAWLAMILADRTTPALYPLVLYGDLIWWLPFSWYLLRANRWRGTVIVWFSVLVHLLASVGLLLVAPGTELTPDPGRRHAWIVESTGTWVAIWTCWSLSSISLLATCWAWSIVLREVAGRWVVNLACAVIAIGVGFDLAGETVMIVRLTRPDLTAAEFAAATRTYQLLSPIIANGLYPVGGVVLSYLAWRGNQLRGAVGIAGLAMWLAAVVLTVATVGNHTPVMAASGAVIMVLYLIWASVLGWRLMDHATSPSAH